MHLHNLACAAGSHVGESHADIRVPACWQCNTPSVMCASPMYCRCLHNNCTSDGLLAVARPNDVYLQAGMLMHCNSKGLTRPISD